MNTKKLLLWGAVFALPIFTMSSCDDDDDDNKVEDSESSEAYTNVINNYVDVIVVPTYKEMKEKSKTLLEKVEAFTTGGTDAQLEAACDAWRNTREPWEESEAFLFGPAATYGLDPMLDSWPLDKSTIDSYLSSSVPLDVASVRDGLGATVRGFHTLEYLLFEGGQPRKAENVTARQKEYMLAVATVLRDDCLKLWYYWHGADNVDSDDQEVLDELEVETTSGGFAERFKTPNMYDQSFKTQVDVIWQIVDGCTDISGEVGGQKIGGPYETQKVEEVESWYSWNSLTDYEDNIISIQHSYLGTLSDDISELDSKGSGNSISAVIAAADSDLDASIRADIKAAREAIESIPAPFRNNLTASTEIEDAMSKLSKLTDSLNKIKTIIK